MKRFFLFIFSVLFAVAMQAQRQVEGQVQDAENGEPLPYAKVYVDARTATLTNADGYFRLTVPEGSRVTLSYIGYEQMVCSAEQLHGVVRMKPLTNELGEVTVRAYDLSELVGEVIDQLKASYKKGRKARAPFFYRTIFTNDKRHEMVEAFMKANPAVNLRKMAVVSGVMGAGATGDGPAMGIVSTNIQHLMEVAPKTYDSYRWMSCIKPFDKVSTFERYYEASAVSVGSGAEEIIKMEFTQKPGRLDLKGKGLMVGTAYVRAADKCLLRFDGQVLYQTMLSGISRVPMELQFSMQYDYSDGYAKLSSLYIDGGGEFEPNVLSRLSKIRYRTILFHVEDDSLMRIKGTKLENNMLEAVQKAGFDSELWDRYEVIRRTDEEERLAFGQNLVANRMLKDKHGEEYVPHIDSTDNAQLSGLLQRQRRFAALIPQEKVYVHMDNTCYFQGDTIWFAAYTRKTNTDCPSDMSGVLYVELLNNDGYLVERKKLRVVDGRANGFFALNKPYSYSGYYELRAYTRWQLNWGVTEHPHSLRSHRWFISDELEHNYFRDYEKLYSRVFPVFDRPEEEGRYMPQMSMRPLQRPSYQRKDEKPASLRLTLYPEGGNLVEGQPCRVAFEACRENGEWAEGTLSVVQEQGQDDERHVALHRGRGCFEVTPRAGQRIRVKFTASDGEEVEVSLPRPESSGATLRVEPQGEDWILHCRMSADIPATAVGLVVSHEGKVMAFYSPDGRDARFTFEPPQGMSGVYQATLFTEDGRVLADRLFFHRAKDMAVSPLRVEDVAPDYAPFAPIRFSLQGTGPLQGTPVSLAVREMRTTFRNHDTGNILTEMLLSSEIRGFVPDPGWYFEADDSVHRTGLDLLMMTQGWRRFGWQEMAVKGKWEFTQPREKQLVVKGQVYPSMLADPRLREIEDELRVLAPEWVMGTPFPEDRKLADRWEKTDFWVDEDRNYFQKQKSGSRRDSLKNEYYLHAMLQSGTGKHPFQDMKTRRTGAFEARMPHFYGESALYLAATPSKHYKPGRKFEWKEMEDRLYLTRKELRKATVAPSKTLVLVDHPYPRFVKPYTYYQKQVLPPKLLEVVDYQLDPNVTQMDEVLVNNDFKGKQRFTDRFPAFVLDHMDALNATIDAGLYYEPNIQMKTVLGDMGLEGINGREEDLAYFLATRNNELEDAFSDKPPFVVRHRLGNSQDRHLINEGREIPLDSLYDPENLRSRSIDIFLSDYEIRSYLGLGAIDKSVYYTDYSPRLIGDRRYKNDFPEVNIVHYSYGDQGQYPVYADRCFRFSGYAYPAEFYSPDYSRQAAPDTIKDYRRTLYWNPNVVLDKEGKAQITLYNNMRMNQIEIDVAGQAADGTLLWKQQE